MLQCVFRLFLHTCVLITRVIDSSLLLAALFLNPFSSFAAFPSFLITTRFSNSRSLNQANLLLLILLRLAACTCEKRPPGGKAAFYMSSETHQ